MKITQIKGINKNIYIHMSCVYPSAICLDLDTHAP